MCVYVSPPCLTRWLETCMTSWELVLSCVRSQVPGCAGRGARKLEVGRAEGHQPPRTASPTPHPAAPCPRRRIPAVRGPGPCPASGGLSTPHRSPAGQDPCVHGRVTARCVVPGMSPRPPRSLQGSGARALRSLVITFAQTPLSSRERQRAVALSIKCAASAPPARCLGPAAVPPRGGGSEMKLSPGLMKIVP